MIDYKTFCRFIKYGLVGSIGFVVNVITLFILSYTKLPLEVRSPIAIEAAIICNFFFHRHWTWAERKTDCKKAAFHSFLRFNLVMGSVGLLFNTLPLILLVKFAGWYEPVANLAGIGIASLINFTASNLWIFKKKPHQ